MKRRTGWTAGTVVVVAVAIGAAVAAGGDGGEAPAATVEVTVGDVVDRALAVGTIEPRVEVSVKSKVSGVVSRRFAEVGDYVRAGAPLLEVRPDPTPLELVEARRNVELRELELDNARRDLERQESLNRQSLVSEQEYENARRRFAEARLQLQVARERLALLEEGKVATAGGSVEAVVKSPIDGYILESMVEIGDPVVPLSSYQEGTVLLTMADMKELVFRGTVDEIDVGRLREGMPAEIKVGALPDAKVTGRLSRISLKAQREQSSGAITFPVEVELDDAAGATLRAGYSANAEIVIRKKEGVLLVPERVLHFDGDTTWVTVQLPDGTTEKRIVRTGLGDAIRIEIVEGLSAGELVVEKTNGAPE